jgi:hypothetical protein
MVIATDTVVDRSVGDRPLFRVDEAVYTWNHVVERARLSGAWAELEDEARGGLGALCDLDARGEAPDAEDVEDAARSFRYARGLLAGDELESWLGSRGLSFGAWQSYLRRSLARDLAPEAQPVGEVAAAEVWVEGICSGALEELAAELAALVAVLPETPPDRLVDEYEDFCRAAASHAAIVREIDANGLDWVRVSHAAALFPDEDSAAEAALCVRADGEALLEVAARAGVELEERVDWMDEVGPELQARFLAAEAGDLVGPVRTEGGFALAHVRAKTPPSAEDEEVRSRAADAVSERAVARRVEERVVWVEPL